MRNIPEHHLRQSRVTAVFEDSALSFILGKGATLEDLSDRLGNLGRRHDGMPVAIIVKFGSSSRKSGSHRKRRPAFAQASRGRANGDTEAAREEVRAARPGARAAAIATAELGHGARAAQVHVAILEGEIAELEWV
jgi:hypothetical protein